jgi:hypothetical protein
MKTRPNQHTWILAAKMQQGSRLRPGKILKMSSMMAKAIAWQGRLAASARQACHQAALPVAKITIGKPALAQPNRGKHLLADDSLP